MDPSHYKVELESERVHVLRINYGSRKKSVMHGHPATVAVFTTNGNFRFTYPDGRTEDIQTKAGQVMALDALVLLPENLNDQPFEVILVELKT